MPTYFVRDRDRIQIRQLRTVKNDAVPVTVDFSPWAEDNGTVSTVTWTVKSGSATISGEALSASSASAVVTTANPGDSLVEVKGAGATHTKVFNLRVHAKDPYQAVPDYGFGG